MMNADGSATEDDVVLCEIMADSLACALQVSSDL